MYQKSMNLAGPFYSAYKDANASFNPDTFDFAEQTVADEGGLAKRFAVDHPILFLLRQNGSEAKGWRGTPFYWPVVRAQKNTPTAIYTAETIPE